MRVAVTILAVMAMCAPAMGADDAPVPTAADTRVETAPAAVDDARADTAADTASAKTNTPRPDNSVSDEIDLETTAIKGSQELPRVLVIVPWKKAQPGQIEGRPANSLLDEALAPVDREVFARQIEFYRQITTETNDE